MWTTKGENHLLASKQSHKIRKNSGQQKANTYLLTR
jgi:hypothetical protein